MCMTTRTNNELMEKNTVDFCDYFYRRFARHMTNNSKWIKERSHEAYAKNYSTVFPFDEPLASRGMIKDALHEVCECQC